MKTLDSHMELRLVADRLEAWAETHERNADSPHVSELGYKQEQRNMAENYRELANRIRQAIFQIVARPEKDRRAPNESYAVTDWTICDVQAVFDVADDEARAFLADIERQLRDDCNSAGWNTIERAGEAKGWKQVSD